MTAYNYDNLPNESSEMGKNGVVPEELTSLAQEAILNIINSNNYLAMEARAYYVYDRKGYMNFDAVGGPRNLSYGRKSDDMILQLTVRVQHHVDAPDEVSELENALNEFKTQEEREKLEREIAEAEAQVQKVQQDAERKRARLEELKKKR